MTKIFETKNNFPIFSLKILKPDKVYHILCSEAGYKRFRISKKAHYGFKRIETWRKSWFLEKNAEIEISWKKFQKIKFLAKNCRNLKIMANFLLLVV